MKLTGLLALIALLALAASAQPRLTASVDRAVVGMGDTFTFTLKFEGVAPSAAPQLPPIDGLPVVAVGQGSQVSIINNQMTRSVNFNYTIAPQREGDFTIPALSYKLNDANLITQPVKVKITKDALAESVKRMAFAELSVPQRDFYVGEVIPVEYRLYFQALGEDPAMPKFNADGFTMLGKPHVTQIPRVQTNGQVFDVIQFNLALSAPKEGELTLGPFEERLVLRIPRQGRNADPFGFGGLFTQYDARVVELKSEAPKLRILPLPAENAPRDFSGSIGQFQMAVSAGPSNVGVGDPVTVKVKITGRGALDAVTLPSFDQWRGFKSYPPTAKIENADALGTQGEKHFEVVVVPQSADVREIPPVMFSYFDSTARAYRTLTQPPIKLTVRSSGPTMSLPTLKGRTGDGIAAASEMAHIKPRPGTLAVVPPALVQQPWFIGLHLIPLAAWIGALAWRKRKEHHETNPHLRRERESAEAVRSGMQRLHAIAAANDSDRFHSTAFRVLQEMIGEYLQRPASSITESAVDELVEHAVPERLSRGLHAWFQHCDQARYAPVKTAQELASLIPDLQGVVDEFRKFRKGDGQE